MKDGKGPHDFDGSEFDKKATSLHNQFLMQLSLYTSNDVIMNREESATSPYPDKEVSSAILNLPLKSLKQDATEEESIRWRLEKNGFPFVLSDSECGDSSYDSSFSEQSSTISTPSTPFTLQSDTQSEDLNRTDIWVSSFLDLDAEDSALLPGKEQFPDVLGYDFPSPSFSAVRSLQFGPPSSSAETSQRKEANDSDEPIFWPFERTCYNSPEFDRFLSVSPRRNTMDIEYAEVRQLNPVLQRLHKTKLASAKKSAEPHRGTTSSGTKASSQEKIQKAPAIPSRLSRTAKASAPSGHQVPSNCQRRRPPHLKLGAPRRVSNAPKLQTDQPLKETGARGIQKQADRKSRIEELIGLDEFDGHEGIGLDSPDYQFSLWMSPRCHDATIKHEPAAYVLPWFCSKGKFLFCIHRMMCSVTVAVGP